MSATTAQPSSIHPAEMPIVRAAAGGACGILLSFAGLQVALAAGAPLGEHVWGCTQDSRLPTGMRVVAVASALTALVSYRTRHHRSVGLPT